MPKSQSPKTTPVDTSDAVAEKSFLPRRLLAKLAFGSLVVLGVSRCSTVSERSDFGLRAPSSLPPGETTPGTLDQIKDPAARAVVVYRAATTAMNQKQNVEACEGFRNLALDLTLPEPVRLLARVRALPICPPDRVLPLAQPPKWLAEESARALVTVARRTKDKKALGIALREISPFEKTQKQRVTNLQEARELLNAAEGTTPTDPDLEKERALTLDRLVTTAPRFSLDLPGARTMDSMLVASDLRNARDFDRARKIFEDVADDRGRSNLERLRALDGIRMSYKLELRTPEFIEASRRWQEFAKVAFLKAAGKRKDPSLLKTYLDTRIQYARAIWTDHRSGEAGKILLETEKQIKGRISVHESMLIRARIAEENRNFNETAAILAQVPIDGLPDRATKARFLWYKGWNLRRLPTLASKREAIAALELAQKHEDRHSDLTRDMYWAARLYKEIGETERARLLFTDLADFSQFGFYGIVAQRELGLPFPSLKSEGANGYDPRRASLIADSIRVPVDWFVILGEHDIGRRYVESFSPKEIWDHAWTLDKKEAMLVLLSRLEQHISVNLRIDELTAEDRKRLLLKRPELLFPLPFKSRILEEATKQTVPPELIYSIMRQESLFNTFARSPADAFGLMQLIPQMAAKAAKSLGVEFHGPDDLYDPDKNIALGAVFLKNTFKDYDGKFILSVAAYNANERAIRGWVKTRMRADPLEFIEEIPYDETRLYVKLVMRNFVTYQRRLSSTPVQFPEDLLSLPNGRDASK